MTKVVAAIRTSVDGYIAGPDDGPGKGLGDGGERLHYWVFGGPWTYDAEPRGEPTGDDAEWLEDMSSKIGAVVAGRWTYEAARHWGDKNPWELPFFIVTHRPEEEPEGGEFTFVDGVEAAVERAKETAGDKDVNLMGGADVIRQALPAGVRGSAALEHARVVRGGVDVLAGDQAVAEREHVDPVPLDAATLVVRRGRGPVAHDEVVADVAP